MLCVVCDTSKTMQLVIGFVLQIFIGGDSLEELSEVNLLKEASNGYHNYKGKFSYSFAIATSIYMYLSFCILRYILKKL